jgi:hypothetical protein
MKPTFNLLTFLFLCFQGFAQYPCQNSISTNPLLPLNNQLGSKANTFFNWEDQFWALKPLNLGNCTRPNITESPFYRTDNLEELRESKDMKYEDGWELVMRKVGLNESNQPYVDNDNDIGIFLYNKYTGILRILFRTCRGADYNGSAITIQFDGTSSMRTDLLEIARGNVSALDKLYSPVSFSAGGQYTNNDTKWFYADFPMTYDPCTCLYPSKLRIVSNLIATSTLNITGGVTGDIYSKNTAGKAQIEKNGSYSWKDFSAGVNGKLSAGYSSIDKFTSETQKLAENVGTTDTSGRKDALDKFASFLKDNQFLRAGLNAVPWLKSAVGVIDFFTGGGNKTAGPQEVKILPMAVNLTAKLTGTSTFTAPYHNIVFTNPGSKNAQLDPSVYPYYNEVMGVFNLLGTPTLFVQANSNTYIDEQSEYRIGFQERRFKLDVSTLKYVVNPAAGLTIQDMKAAILIGGQRRTFPICSNQNLMLPDFQFEGKDALTNVEKFRTDYFDMNCFSNRVFEAKYYSNSVAAGSASYQRSDIGCPTVDNSQAWLKLMINFSRNNATANTQNVLYVVTFPLKIVTDNNLRFFNNTYVCNGPVILPQASASEVTSHCNNTVKYYTSSRRLSSIKPDVDTVPIIEKLSISVSPNPTKGLIALSIAPTTSSLLNIKLFSADGRLINELYRGNKWLRYGYSQTLNLNLVNGTYHVLVKTNDGTVTKKIIVVK